MARNLGTGEYIGEVVAIDDPQHMGRCRVRVYGLFDQLEVEHIPWAYPSNNLMFAGGESGGFGCISVPKIGDKVRLRFNNGDQNAPEYFAILDINESLQQKLADSYEGAHAFWYDEDAELWGIYTEKDGLDINLKGSHINIDNSDNGVITIEAKNTRSIIQLVGSNLFITSDNAITVTTQAKVEINAQEVHVNGGVVKLGQSPLYNGVRGQALMACLKAMAAQSDLKWAPTPGTMSSLVANMESLILSPTVTIS